MYIYFLAICFLATFLQAHETEQKIAVFIVGAPRSGTSATTGVLKIMGLPLGDDLVGPLPDNQKGHFEDVQVMSYNRKLYKSFGNKHTYTGFAIPDPWFQSPDGQHETAIIKNLIQHRFGRHRCFGIKNPLLSFFLPCYITAARSLFYIPKLIIVIRNPLEIAYSIQRRTNIGLEQILNVVTNYLTCIYRYSISLEKIVILFDDLLHKTNTIVQKLISFLPDLQFSDDTELEIQEFLDQSLKHHDYRRSKQLTPQEQKAYKKALKIYNLFLQQYTT